MRPLVQTSSLCAHHRPAVAALYIRDVSSTPGEWAAQQAIVASRVASQAALKIGDGLAPPPRAATASSAAGARDSYPPSLGPRAAAPSVSAVVPPAAPSDEVQNTPGVLWRARMAAARQKLPRHVVLRTWREGSDLQEESLELVQRLQR